MAWGFRKSASIGKLIRVNLSGSGVGFSIGIPGLRIGVGADGKVRRTTSIPGTGLRNTQVLGGSSRSATETCPHCGKRIARRDQYCRSCGGRV